MLKNEIIWTDTEEIWRKNYLYISHYQVQRYKIELSKNSKIQNINILSFSWVLCRFFVCCNWGILNIYSINHHWNSNHRTKTLKGNRKCKPLLTARKSEMEWSVRAVKVFCKNTTWGTKVEIITKTRRAWPLLTYFIAVNFVSIFFVVLSDNLIFVYLFLLY